MDVQGGFDMASSGNSLACLLSTDVSRDLPTLNHEDLEGETKKSSGKPVSYRSEEVITMLSSECTASRIGSTDEAKASKQKNQEPNDTNEELELANARKRSAQDEKNSEKDDIQQKKTKRKSDPKLPGSGRQYLRWSTQATESLLTHFKPYIEDTNSKENKGKLPGYAEIQDFLEKTGVMQIIDDMKKRIKVTHTKIFNERKRFREIYARRIKELE